MSPSLEGRKVEQWTIGGPALHVSRVPVESVGVPHRLVGLEGLPPRTTRPSTGRTLLVHTGEGCQVTCLALTLDRETRKAFTFTMVKCRDALDDTPLR